MRIRLVLVLYLANLVFALLIAAPFIGSMSDTLAHSTATADLSRQFHPLLALDLVGGAEDALDGRVRYAAFLYALFSTVLAGGVISSVARRERRSTLGDFSLACGRYCGRFVRLLAIAIAALIMLQLLNGLAEYWITQLLAGSSVSMLELGRFGKSGAMAAALYCLFMVLDYARVRIVLEDRSSAVAAFGAGCAFFLRNPFTTVGVQMAFTLLAVLVVGAGIAVTTWVVPADALVTLVMVQQLTVLIGFAVGVAAVGARVDVFCRAYGLDELGASPTGADVREHGAGGGPAGAAGVPERIPLSTSDSAVFSVPDSTYRVAAARDEETSS